jgi:hypothetical protein
VRDPLGWPAATAITALVLVLGVIGVVWANDAEPGWAVGLVLTGVGAVVAGALGGYAAARPRLLAAQKRIAELEVDVTRATERGEEAAYRNVDEYLDRRKGTP